MTENNDTQINYGKVALFGAAGAIGKSIATALRAQGESYRVVGRDRQKLESTFGADPRAEIVTWNTNNAESITNAATGIDTIVYLVGVPYNKFELHPILMQKTLDGAVAAGVKRILLIGTVYAYGKPQTPTVAESHPRNPTTKKGQYRKQQEEILFQAHADGKIQATILRLPDFYGFDAEDKSLLQSLFKAAATGGTADLLGPIDLPHQFVYVPDVGPVVLQLLAQPGAYGQWWNFAGSGVTTVKDMVQQVFAMAGRKPKYRAIGNTITRLIGLFNPIIRELVEMNYLITTPVILEDSALTSLIGSIDKTSYADGLRQTFDAYAQANANARH